MKSKWELIKPKAIELRGQGNSIRSICAELRVPLSTLSTWLRNTLFTPEQEQNIDEERRKNLERARDKAREWHHAGKAQRLVAAEDQAKEVLDKLSTQDDELIELALAFLYLGEGAKQNETSLGSSNLEILKFFIYSIRRLYGVKTEQIRCYLHLRSDQNETDMKEYWSNELHIPLENFRKTSFDRRTIGRITYESYKGVCVIWCGKVEIQRRLMYVANGFCKMVSSDSESSAISSIGRAQS